MNALEIKGLTKNYRGFRLDGIDLVLPSGCIMGLIGENGAGKSTTIKMILDMIRREGVPDGIGIRPVSIEELFVFMIRGRDEIKGLLLKDLYTLRVYGKSYVMIGIVCGAGVAFSELFQGEAPGIASSAVFWAGLPVVGIGAYVLSWYLSVVFYRKREW